MSMMMLRFSIFTHIFLQFPQTLRQWHTVAARYELWHGWETVLAAAAFIWSQCSFCVLRRVCWIRDGAGVHFSDVRVVALRFRTSVSLSRTEGFDAGLYEVPSSRDEERSHFQSLRQEHCSIFDRFYTIYDLPDQTNVFVLWMWILVGFLFF